MRNLPKIEPPNDSGSTHCVVRWMCQMGNGLWLGAWEKKSFAEFERLVREDEREKCASALRITHTNPAEN